MTPEQEAKPECYVHVDVGKETEHWKKMTDATRVVIDGFEDIILFVHRHPEGLYGFVVTEGFTGAKVAWDRNRPRAIKVAEAAFRRSGNNIGKHILKIISRKNDMSPWFKEYFGVKP